MDAYQEVGRLVSVVSWSWRFPREGRLWYLLSLPYWRTIGNGKRLGMSVWKTSKMLQAKLPGKRDMVSA